MNPISHILTFAILALSSRFHAQTLPVSPDKEPISLRSLSAEDDSEKDGGIALDPSAATGVVQDDTDAPQKTADEGIQIQVEKAQPKSGAKIISGQVKILSPWPAKPISAAPEGWEFAPAPAGLVPYRKNVKLDSGNEVVVTITPFVLEPLSDGLNAIRIAEPGYDPAQKYNQKDTVGTMLKNSTMELEQNEKQAASAIRRLQLLLSSLPK